MQDGRATHCCYQLSPPRSPKYRKTCKPSWVVDPDADSSGVWNSIAASAHQNDLPIHIAISKKCSFFGQAVIISSLLLRG